VENQRCGDNNIGEPRRCLSFASALWEFKVLRLHAQSPTAKPAASLPLGSIAGFVWDDTPTNDSIYTFSDTPLPNVPISLHECDSDKFVQATISSSDGTFNLNNLLSGSYRVRVIPVGSQEWSYVSKNVNEGLATNQIIGEDSDVNNDGTSDCIAVNDGLQALIYAGLTRPISLKVSGRVYHASAIIDHSNRDSVANLVVDLYECSNPDQPTWITLTRTDSSGNYQFAETALMAQENVVAFRAVFSLPSDDYEFVPAGANSDVNEKGETACWSIAQDGGGDIKWNAGIRMPQESTESPTPKPTFRPTTRPSAKPTVKPAPTGSTFTGGLIGGYSFRDVNDDGIRPITLLEPAVPNVNIRLYSCNLPDNQEDGLLAIQRTDSQGFYSFRNLFKGSYRVDISPPNGFDHGTVWTGTDDGVDNSIDPATGSTICFSLNGDETDISYDIALVAKASTTDEPTQAPANDSFGSTVIVSGFVFYDVDNDGYFEPQDKETPLPGLQAALFSCTGSLFYIGNTDENGMYGFNDLEPGGYLVKFLSPEGYVVSDIWSGLKDQDGNFVAADATNDANPENSSTVCRDYKAGEAEFQLNAGMYLVNAGCTNDGDNPCSGCPCESENQCRSSSGLCGGGIAFCNPLSLWRADCPAVAPPQQEITADSTVSPLPDQNSTKPSVDTPSSLVTGDTTQCNEDGSVGNINSSGVVSKELSFRYAIKSKNGQSPDNLLISEFERQLQDRLSCVYFDYLCLMCSRENDPITAKDSVRHRRVLQDENESVLTGLAPSPQDLILPLAGKFRRFGSLDFVQ